MEVRKVSSLEFMREMLKDPYHILHSIAAGLALIAILHQDLAGQPGKGLLIFLVLWLLSAPSAWLVEVGRYVLKSVNNS